MEEIADSIEDYVNSDSTDYAVMINGDWGSGKTYFWNNYLKKKIEKSGYRTLYVSLYGVSSIDEISRKIFSQAYFASIKEGPLTKYKGALSEIGKLVINVWGQSKGIDFISTMENINFDQFVSFEKTVLCFDDLERANMDITEVLGYINNFVEHDKIKTILICNEREIHAKGFWNNAELKKIAATNFLNISKEDNKDLIKDEEGSKKKSKIGLINETVSLLFGKSNDYKNIKEKLIGRTFYYQPKADQIRNSIFELYSEYESYDFLLKKSKLITEIFLKSDTRNFRILKQALSDFERVYKSAKKEFPDLDEEITTSILTFCLVFSFEVKSGRLDLQKIDSNEEFQQRYIHERLDESPSYIIGLMTKYTINYKFSSFSFYLSVKELVLNGVLHSYILSKEINKRIEELTPSELPGYIKIIRNGYWDLPDEEFLQALEETYLAIKDGEMKLSYYYLGYRVFSEMLKQELIEETKESLKELFIKGITKAAEKQEYQKDLGAIFISHEVIDSDAIEIKELVLKVNEKLLEREDKKQAEKLLSLMDKDMKELYREIHDNNWERPVFIHIESTSVVDKLVKAENEDINLFLQSLKTIYRAETIKYLEDDIPKLREIAEQLGDYCNTLNRDKFKIKYLNLQEVIRFISEIGN